MCGITILFSPDTVWHQKLNGGLIYGLVFLENLATGDDSVRGMWAFSLPVGMYLCLHIPAIDKV